MKAFNGAVLVAVSLASAALGQVFQSGERAVPLVELFTSEGCSSCPPAEQWVGELRHDPALWRNFVPVVWHVNYWDRLGWPDRFAHRSYTDRQYAYAKAWASGRVYTPGFVRAGVEWRPRTEGLKPSERAMAGGELIATVKDEAVLVEFKATSSESTRWVHVARLGGGIVSDVRQGENRGKQLTHEFLVLGWTRVALRQGRAELRLPERWAGADPIREAVAIWVSEGEAPAPIQATGGWLDCR
jgi:hypothetical protein